MLWLTTLGLSIVFSLVSQVYMKTASALTPPSGTGIPSKSIGVLYQFCVALPVAIIAWVGFVLYDPINAVISPWMLGFVFATGIVVVIGVYVQWVAIDLNMGKTALASPLANALTIVLAMVFLQEYTLLTPRFILGLGLSFIALFSLAYKQGVAQTAQSSQDNKKRRQWLLAMTAYIITWGTVWFLEKLFSYSVPIHWFAVGRYLGAVVGMLTLVLLTGQKASLTKISKRGLGVTAIIGCLIAPAMMLVYATLQLGVAASIVFPARGLFMTFAPVLLGRYLFGENKTPSRQEIVGFIVGSIGAVLLILP